MNRRRFLVVAGLAPAVTRAATRRIRAKKVFLSPGPQPNGMQATAEGLWILDQRDNKAYLVRYEDGSVIRSVQTEADRGSGMTFDGQSLWIASTYNCRILKVDPQTGKTLGNYPTPGSGPVHWANPRRTKTGAAPPPKPASGPPRAIAITGSHGMEWRDGKLWVASPPSKIIYRIDPARGFGVEHEIPAPGDRPHGLGWDGKWLWCADTNAHAIFRLDPETGHYAEKIELEDDDPGIHGMSLWKGQIWYCDADTRAVCTLPLP